MADNSENVRELLGQINRDDSIYVPKLILDENPAAQNLATISPRQLEHLMDQSVLKYDAPDRKMAAAFCMNKMSWSILRPLADYALNNYMLTAVPHENFSLKARNIHWEVEGESGVYQTLDVYLNLNRSSWQIIDLAQADLHDFTHQIETLFAPLVDMHFQLSNLAKPALWRLVGDSLAAAFLAQGENFDCPDKAMQAAEKILKRRGTKLFSKQVGFFNMSLPERPDTAEWFRARGGCCRYYTSKDGEYCTTCVLRDEESRNARLQTYLREKHLGDAAA